MFGQGVLLEFQFDPYYTEHYRSWWWQKTEGKMDRLAKVITNLKFEFLERTVNKLT